MSDKNSSRIIGVIGKPYGLKGYVFVRVVTDYPETIKKGDFLYIDECCKKKITIDSIKNISVNGKKRTIFKFDGYDDIDRALLLRDKLLHRHKKDAPSPGKGSFWIEDLLDCKVYLKDKDYIGKVIDVEKYAYNDNLIVENEKKEEIAIPMISYYILEVDIEGKKIILNMFPEYI